MANLNWLRSRSSPYLKSEKNDANDAEAIRSGKPSEHAFCTE
jgi:hypothetical protein